MLAASCHSGTDATQPQPATAEQWQQRAADEATRADNWRITFWLMAVIVVLLCVFERWRLVRKIWKRNAQLREALEHADESNRMKAAFIRNMSHEIRTPLNAINGFSQVLCDPSMEFNKEEKRQMKHSISENVQGITIIINELLELAKEESKVDHSSFTHVLVNETCQQALDAAQVNNTNKLKLIFHSELPDSFYVRTDIAVLRQILDQLIADSLLYTPSGHVAIYCSHIKHGIMLSIEDTGVGVPEERREHLFDSYISMEDFKSGLGLKLATCRRLAKALGGDLSYDPQYAPGSRFVLQLPT